MFDIISTREFAHITLYGSVILFCFIKSEKLRHSLFSLIKLIFNPKAFLIFDFFTLYEAVMLLPITYLPFWKNAFYKDFIFWVILGGYPALLKNLKTSNADFRKMVFKQFIFSSAVEYLTGMITFNLLVEYFLCIFFSILIIADICCNIKQGLAVLHYVKIVIRYHIKCSQNLIKHLPVLCSNANNNS